MSACGCVIVNENDEAYVTLSADCPIHDTDERETLGSPSAAAKSPTMTDRLVRCRYLKADGNQCTAEAAVPFADAMLCTRHISDAVDGFKMVRQIMWGDKGAAMVERLAEQKRAAEEHRLTGGVVYYGKAWGYIKIGTSYRVNARAASLKMDLIATEPGSYELEKQRHKQFEHWRHLGEYYHPSPELLLHIEDVLAQHGPPAKSREERRAEARRVNGLA